ncbi:hypothetical protein IIA28_16085 [candidate division KSB1 bacterium]|nr:hypothetical protein [candidate division KSB1 bacterium]
MARRAKQDLAIFEQFEIRRHFDEDSEKWVFSVIDIVAALTEQSDYQKSRKYWNKLKERLQAEGSQTVTNCHQLKLLAQDGKMRMTDITNTEQLLPLIQSVPSSKAELFKMC